MLDPRITALAELMCDHSLNLTSADTVLIHAFDIPDEAVAEFVRAAQFKGARVVTRLESARIRRQMMLGMTETNARTIAEIERHEMENVTTYIALRGGNNYAEMRGIPDETMQMWSREYMQPVVFQCRVPNTRWVVTRWPSEGMAQQANLSTEAFEKFFFDVCTVDYRKMAEACKPLAELMNKTDRVRLVGPGTDLSFSIKDIGAVPCTGEANIPDGECFSCPVKDSVNGTIAYNTVSLYQSTEFSNIRYVCKDGKIVEATAGEQTEKLNQILDTDDGARYFGEFAIGFNPHVLHPMKDTLFDEKIAGSIHLTPGNAYPPPGGNGNTSAIHWDTVLIQRPEYGGGEIYFDDVLIRKDGLFVTEALAGLNPENLS